MNSNKGNRGAGTGALRVIGGKYRSRVLRVPDRPGLRPTPDRVRETLFNWLGQDLSGLACLDLYAGSGALGFEAASRGAARVVLVEKDRAVVAELERSRATLEADQVTIVGGEAADFLARERGRFDVVFLDAPFRQNALPAMLDLLAARLAPGARVYVESEAPVEVAAPWMELKRARAGQVSYQLLRWDANEGRP
ncbi:MAG: 16S rRNA (guanine(966)-N(2))-methyltransferase RsmD [Betaproteobacteria bacterium]